MRVEIPAPGDLIMDSAGNVVSNVTVSLKLAGTGTDVTHYSALTGGTSTTGGLKSGSDGTIVDGSGNRRYIDSGQALDMTIAGRSRQLDPLSASVDTRVGTLEGDAVRKRVEVVNAFDVELPYTPLVANGSTDDTSALNSLLDRHRGKTILAPPLNPAGSQALLKTSDTIFEWSNTKVKADGVLFRPTSGLVNQAVKFGDAPFTPTGPKSLTANAAESATKVTVSTSDAATFAVGDMVRVDDQRTLGGEKIYHEPNYVDGVNLGTGDITLRAPLINSHATADTAAITKIVATRGSGAEWAGGVWDMVNVPAKGLSTDPDRGVFATYYTEDCWVRGASVLNHVYKLFQQQDCVNSHFIECRGAAPQLDGSGQGYLGSLNGRNNTAEWCRGYNLRHTIDISGGADNEAAFCYAYGRTPSAGQQTAFFLHGIVTKRCKFTSCSASNTKVGFGAGNSTFGVDEDFEFTSCMADGCEDGFLIDQACSGFKISGAAYNCTSRGFVTQNGPNGEVDILCDGCGTSGSGFGSALFSDSTIRGKVKVRNAADRSISVTGLVDIDANVDVDHPSGAGAIYGFRGSSLNAASVVRVRGKLKGNNAAHEAVDISAPSGAVVDVEIETSGTWLRAISVLGGSVDQTAGGRFRGTYGEQIRVDAGELVIRADTSFAASGTAVRAATSVTKVTFEGRVHWNGAATRLSNTASATVVAPEDLFGGTVAQTLAANGAVTVTPTNGEIQRVTLQANATSVTFAAGFFEGQLLELHVIQDATGSRTFAWPTANARYPAATVPTTTTTASRRDIVRYRWNHTDTKWDEISRSLAVG